MIGYRCKNCLWWDNQHEGVKYIPLIDWKATPGFCRRRRAGVVGLGKSHHMGIHPIMDADEFCGEFKKDK